MRLHLTFEAGVVEASQMANLLPPALPPVGIFAYLEYNLELDALRSVNQFLNFCSTQGIARLASSATAKADS